MKWNLEIETGKFGAIDCELDISFIRYRYRRDWSNKFLLISFGIKSHKQCLRWLFVERTAGHIVFRLFGINKLWIKGMGKWTDFSPVKLKGIE